MNIKKTVLVERDNKFLYKELSNFDNFLKIMPDNLVKFNSNEKGFDFTIEGMPSINVELLEKKEFNKISFISTQRSTVKFQIDFLFDYLDENKTNCDISINAELNPFIKMMIEKPLLNLIGIFSEKMKNI